MSEMETKAEVAETPAAEPAPVVEYVTKSVQVPAGADALAQAIVKLYKASETALADGFQATQDLPVLLVEAVRQLPPAVAAVGKVGGEFKADKGKILLALSIALDEVL